MMNISKDINDIKHVYLNDAASLRKDR